MGCITFTRYTVLINGTPTSVFSSNIGLRQCCHLSTYLFILAIEGLSLLIKKAKEQNKFRGLKIAMSIYITRLLFVDECSLFHEGNFSEWQHYQFIISLFCNASGLEVSVQKSSFVYSCDDLDIRNHISSLFP